jgi:hypothetical protein
MFKMGVARSRGVTKYVLVRMSGAEGEEDLKDLETTVASPASIDHLLDSTIIRRQADISNLDFGDADEDYNDDDDLQPSPTVRGYLLRSVGYELTVHSLPLR